jgi:hypothetical protein
VDQVLNSQNKPTNHQSRQELVDRCISDPETIESKSEEKIESEIMEKNKGIPEKEEFADLKKDEAAD